MEVSAEGIQFIASWEGLRLKAYKDVAGIRTIGYGHAYWTGADAITKEQAEELLQADVLVHSSKISRLLKLKPSQFQFDALTSFAFNLGVGALKGSTLLKLFNGGHDMDVVAKEFLRWNKARVNGELKEIKGLTKRREAESKLFLLGIYDFNN